MADEILLLWRGMVSKPQVHVAVKDGYVVRTKCGTVIDGPQTRVGTIDDATCPRCLKLVRPPKKTSRKK